MRSNSDFNGIVQIHQSDRSKCVPDRRSKYWELFDIPPPKSPWLVDWKLIWPNPAPAPTGITNAQFNLQSALLTCLKLEQCPPNLPWLISSRSIANCKFIIWPTFCHFLVLSKLVSVLADNFVDLIPFLPLLLLPLKLNEKFFKLSK